VTSPAASEAFRLLLRDHLRPLLRAEGFAGSGASTWRRRSERGDWAIVNLQRSRQAGRSLPTGQDGVWFTINLAVVSNPWWEWVTAYYEDHYVERERRRSTLPDAAAGYWRTRLNAPAHLSVGYPNWWTVHDGESAHACGRDVTARLTGTGIPEVLRHLPRDAQLTAARTGRFDGTGNWGERAALAVLLADDGPSPELDRLLAVLERERGYERLIDWLRQDLSSPRVTHKGE
jgi:hypothetical protein